MKFLTEIKKKNAKKKWGYQKTFQKPELNDWQLIDSLLQSFPANIPRQESSYPDQNVVAGYYFVKKLWNLKELNYMDWAAFISLLKLDSLKKKHGSKKCCMLCTITVQKTLPMRTL